MPTWDPTLVKKPCFHLLKPLQALGVPGRVDGSGYIMVNSVAVDAQVLVTMDANTLRGLFILNTTEVRVWMGGVPRVAWEGVLRPCAPEARGEAFGYPRSSKEDPGT